MRKSLKLISLIITITLFLCSCSTSKTTNVSNGDTTFDEQKNGGTIKMGTVPVDTLNPLLTIHSSVRDFLSLVYEGLFVAMPDLSATPVLASEYVTSGDNTVYTIKLKGGVKFHSGKAFSSEDVVATLSYIENYGGKYTSVTDAIASYTASSSDTVIITLKRPIADFVNLLDFPILPSGLDYEAFVTPSSGFTPDGTGIYSFEGITEHKNIYLKANETWHNSEKRAHIDKIDVEILSDEETIVSAFDAGIIDIFALSWKNPSELTLISNSYNVFETPQNMLTFLGINNASAAFDTKEERALFVTTINRDKLCEDIMLGRASAALYPIRDGVYFDEENVMGKDNSETDTPNETTVKIEKPSEINLLYNSDNKTKKRLALALKQQLDIAGYNTVLNPQPFETYLSKVANCEYDVYVGEVNIDNASNLEFMFGKASAQPPVENEDGEIIEQPVAIQSMGGISNFADTKLTDIIDNLNSAKDAEAMKLSYNNLKIFYEANYPQIPLFHMNDAIFVNSRIKGALKPNLTSFYADIGGIYIE